MEAVRSFDSLLEYSCFMGYEAKNLIGTGIIGAEANHQTIQVLLDFYDEEIWQYNFCNNPMVFTKVREIQPEAFKHCKIFPQEYFSPYEPGMQLKSKVDQKETYTIHWYSKNWNMSRKGYVFLHTKHITNPVWKVFASMKKTVGYYRHR